LQSIPFMEFDLLKEILSHISKIFHSRRKYISSDVPTMQIVDTSEKAFTPIPSDEIWLPIAIGSFFEIRGYGRVYTEPMRVIHLFTSSSLTLFVYPLIPFIFYSRAAPLHRESQCPSASLVVFRFCLPKCTSIERAFPRI